MRWIRHHHDSSSTAPVVCTCFQHRLGHFFYKERDTVGAVNDLRHDFVGKGIVFCDLCDQRCARVPTKSAQGEGRHMRLGPSGTSRHSVIEELAGDWRWLDQRIDGLSGKIEALARLDQACLRLMTVPGIGPIISSAMVAANGHWRRILQRPRRRVVVEDHLGSSGRSAAGHRLPVPRDWAEQRLVGNAFRRKVGGQRIRRIPVGLAADHQRGLENVEHRGGFAPWQSPGQRCWRRAEFPYRKAGLEEAIAVGQADGDEVTGLYPFGGKGTGAAVGPALQLLPGERISAMTNRNSVLRFAISYQRGTSAKGISMQASLSPGSFQAVVSHHK